MEVGQKVVKSDPPYDYVVPYPQKEIGRPMTKVVSTNNSVRISSYAAAWKWDGKPKGQTDVYHGH